MKKLIIIILIFPFIIYGQGKINFNQGLIVQKNFCDTIPFESLNGLMIVAVKVNGQTKRFLFDTGASLVISEDIQNEMKNPQIATVKVRDVLGKRIKMPVVQVKELQVGKLIFQNMPSVIYNEKNIGLLACFNYDGIIGSNLLRNCIVHINTEKKIIILTNNIDNLKLQNAFPVTLKFNKQFCPWITLNLDDKIKVDAMFDSGSNSFMEISKKNSKKSIKKGISRVLNQGFGIYRIAFNSIGRPKKKLRTSIKNVKFGEASINNVVSIVSKENNNAVGMPLCEYGTVTIDYINKKFYFIPKEPNQSYKQQKTVGFSWQLEKNRYSIGIVWSNTQAEKIGLKRGFQLFKINDFDITKRTSENDCILLFLKLLNNSKITITYKDDKDQIKTVELSQE